MGKRSQKFGYEKDQSGCMRGFISMFDFRHGRSTRKLIADKRRSSKHAVGAVHSKNKFEILRNLDEDCQENFDAGERKRPTAKTDANKPSMKKLIEEEMIIDQDAMKDIFNAKVESKETRLGHEDLLMTDSKRKKKSRKKSRDLDTCDSDFNATLKLEKQHSRQHLKDKLDLDKIMEDFCHLKGASSMMQDNDGEDQAQSSQKHVISENIARDAIHEFVNQMILNGKDHEEARKFLCSHELMEALQLTSSDEDLFLRLLQDPKSLLLKHVPDLGNAHGANDKECNSITGSNFTEQDLGNLRQTRESVNRRHHNFFRKKLKSQPETPTNENQNTEFSNRIVILKPALMHMQNSEAENNPASPLDSHDFVRYKGSSVRPSSHFSLTEIKKKLRHAMGKERHGNPERISKKFSAECQNKRQGSKAISKDNVGMKSPNKDHFFIEKIARPAFDVMKGDKAGAVKDSELAVEHENGNYPKQRVSNLYFEAKKHLCEMLDNGDDNIDFSGSQIPKTLGRILSLPEYNFSPLGSPGRDWDHHFVTAQTRFSATNKIWEDNLSPKQANLKGHLDQATNSPEKQASISDESSTNKVEEIKPESYEIGYVNTAENCCAVRDEIVTEGHVESAKEIKVLESSSKPIGSIAGKDQTHDISEIPDARHSQCLNQDITDENQPSSPPLSPSHSLITKKIEELESGIDVTGRPSPVSVLDTPFLDDDFSPGCSGFQPVNSPIRPLQFQFEDHDSSFVDQIDKGKYGLEESELIYDYVKAVLQASGLTRDQLLMKYLSSDKILDPSLFDEVFFSNLHCYDQKLLFDCINEILMEVCCYYIGVLPWVSFVNPSIRPTPDMKKVILKVWEGVCWHILPLPPPRTLDQIIRKDMSRSGAWMDLRVDAETVGFEMGEVILAELMEDTILSCISESPESTCSQLQFELKDNESSINV